MKLLVFYLFSVILNLILFALFIATQHYSPILMAFHILSLAALWGVLFYHLQIIKLLQTRWKEALIILLLIVASLGVGLYQVTEITPGMYGDEVTVGRKSLALLQKAEWPPFDGVYSHPTPLLYLTAASINTFGHTMTAIRLPSIIFGALAVGAFFLLLRLFFPVSIAVTGSILLLFQYTHVILSRLAYEPPASLFFQIVTMLFVTLYWKTKERIYLIAIALGVGAGLYTYLNFRAFAVTVFFITVFLLVRTSVAKKLWLNLALFISLLLVTAMPLISYSIIDPHGFWLRPAEISIFSRHYSPEEFSKELWGNIVRTGGFAFIGDPNPDKNPSAVTLFDPLTMLVAVVGLVYLFRRKRTAFWILLLMLAPPFVSDIFSTEVIPEFHYYGLGHPNALRVSGLIWVVLFAASAGLYSIYTKWREKHAAEAWTLIGVLVVTISIWNLNLYFNQATINPSFYLYNEDVNHQETLSLISYLNQSPSKKIALTKSLFVLEMVPFFMNNDKQLSSFAVVSTASAQQTILANDATAIDVTKETLPVLQGLVAKENPINQDYTNKIITNPANIPKIVLFENNKFGL